MYDNKVHLLVCNHVEAETRAVLARGKAAFDGVTVSVFPGRCGRPPMTPDQLKTLLLDDQTPTEIVGSTCMSALRHAASLPLCHMNCENTCFDMFLDRQIVASLLAERAYLLTSGWLQSWQERFGEWGFDRESLRVFLRDTIARLHLLDTGIDKEGPRRLEELGEFAGLPTGVTRVGLDFFELHLERIVLRRRLELMLAGAKQDMQRLNQKSADYAMAMDLLGQIAALHEERDVIRRMLDVFTMLFAPQTILFVLYEQDRPMAMYSPGSPMQPTHADVIKRLSTMDSEITNDVDNGTHRVRIAYGGEVFGVVLMEQLACPEHESHYQGLIGSIAPICGLSINNARSYQEVIRTGKALKRANQELARLATTDELTRVANRRQFDDRLEIEWRRASRRRSPLSLLMIDVDFFKQYNDRWGHQAGDQCLKTVAEIIAGCVGRVSDLVARYGGEEFAVILPDTPMEGALHLAERIRNSVARARIEHGTSTVSDSVSLSVGCATVEPSAVDNAARLLLAADRALYDAKRSGRNSVCAAAIELDQAATDG